MKDCKLYSGNSLDRWPSGLRRTPGKRVVGQLTRGFESRPVRLLAQGQIRESLGVDDRRGVVTLTCDLTVEPSGPTYRSWSAQRALSSGRLRRDGTSTGPSHARTYGPRCPLGPAAHLRSYRFVR